MQETRSRIEDAYRSYRHSLHVILFRYLKNHEDVEDILQETFIRVIKFENGFRGESDYKTWLTRIAINCALNYLKIKHKAGHVDFDDAALFDTRLSNHSSAELCAIAEQELDIMNANIKDLSDDLWQVFMLDQLHTQNQQELAAQLKLPEGTIKSRLSRVRKAILGLE